MTELRTVIAGGGLAGMTLAHYLHRRGVAVTVYERDSALAARDPGYRLHINSTGTSALHAALEPRLWALFLAASGMPRDDMLLFDEQLNPGPVRDKHAMAGTGAPTDDVPEHMVMCRSTLRRILHIGLENAVHFGVSVTGYHSNPDATVTVHLDNGDTVEADVLIAADGVNSAVRAQRLPQVQVIDLGSRHITAKIPLTPETQARLPKQMFNTFSLAFNAEHDGLTFGPLERTDPYSPLVKEQDQEFQDEVSQNYALSIFNSLTHRMLPDSELFAASPAKLKAYTLDRVASWHPGLVESVRLWDTDTVQALTLRSCIPTGAWEPSNVTVIGDAIHAMSSALGIGANTALRDAHVLGGELLAVTRGDKALLEGIGEYEEAMRDYGFTAVRMSAAVGAQVIGHHDLLE
ncbi:FAD-dependent oxidoreductase [Mycolicibacterium moriokaense]|uniref:2-polyprenyl-6-methoxyphenol hydroxylase-like FAD-dependent oxidoreductase n=1 Tax=Mycolicibacterium moriokaense TaxID=39691 RepID=A0A318HJ21_9MYCO|nr:NAD(P)/FAD-dependent oxidoreductase [Mycolicibacterium moriokaense]PXX07264.1 2-polyprenyl-6-methoxyphenol hydroxylase-like FAD-dependent oxidoreductase [Mycolicibacterium moriokaense]